MTLEEFEQLVAEEFPNAIPEKFQSHIKNVAFLIEDDVSPQLRARERLKPGQTLLGLYQGIPTPKRGDWYGMGATMPDTITLFYKPIEMEASRLEHSDILKNVRMSYIEYVRKVIKDTIWHEVAHHFGMNEYEVRRREGERT